MPSFRRIIVPSPSKNGVGGSTNSTHFTTSSAGVSNSSSIFNSLSTTTPISSSTLNHHLFSNTKVDTKNYIPTTTTTTATTSTTNPTKTTTPNRIELVEDNLLTLEEFLDKNLKQQQQQQQDNKNNTNLTTKISLRDATNGIKTNSKINKLNNQGNQDYYDEDTDIEDLYNCRNQNNNNNKKPLSSNFNESVESIKTTVSSSSSEEDEEDYCGSDIDGEDFSSVNINYNERFQEIMDDLRSLNCNSTQSDKIRVYSQFIALTQDFVYASSTFGKVIISERYLPNHEKTIPPIDIGGLAGGSKFIVHGILFKFAIDKDDFYGSDYASMCVGGHELKGLINVFNCNVSNISLPLMALVDYRGFRVIAMSILPVDKDFSIVYGSNDYGLNIHNKDNYLSEKVKDIAKLINIKSHHCGEQATYLHSPADLEGHQGFDGRYYMLDFARLFPPEAPKKGIKMGHLYRLLRPEFVRNYKTPLCSDSFSRFIRGHNEEEHNSETLEATNYLLNTTIPELIEELNREELSIHNVYSFPITERLHRSGVNVRYLGYLRLGCNSLDMKSLIFIEMCARVVKQQLRQKLRFKMKQAKIPLEAPYRRLIIAYLNRILGISDKSDLFWNEKMKKYLLKKFDKGLFEDEIKGNTLILGLSSFSDHLIDGKYLLFRRIQKMTGLKFTSRINQEFQLNPNFWLIRGESPLDINDLEEIGIRVKYVPFMNVAQGYLFKVKGEILFLNDPNAATRFFQMALEKLETALETDPNNANTLCTMGEVYSHLGKGSSQGLSELRLDRNNPFISKAFDYFHRSIFSNPNHTNSLFRLAQLLERCGEFDSAEDYYLSSLTTNPNNISCLQEYGNFLHFARNDERTAEEFFVRASKNNIFLTELSMNTTSNHINIRGSSGLLKIKHSRTISSGSSSSSSSNEHNQQQQQQQQQSLISNLSISQPTTPKSNSLLNLPPLKTSTFDKNSTVSKSASRKIQWSRYEGEELLKSTCLKIGAPENICKVVLNYSSDYLLLHRGDKNICSYLLFCDTKSSSSIGCSPWDGTTCSYTTYNPTHTTHWVGPTSGSGTHTSGRDSGFGTSECDRN
eukprot:gene9238-11318_t